MLVFGDDGSKNNNYNNNDLYTPCIQDESEVIYVNGDVSFGRTFIECYSNLANPGLIPTFINGTYNGIERVNISVGLNNLQSVSLLVAPFLSIIITTNFTLCVTDSTFSHYIPINRVLFMNPYIARYPQAINIIIDGSADV